MIALGFFSGFGIFIVISAIWFLVTRKGFSVVETPNLMSFAFWDFILSFPKPSVIEETTFRGFLWGYLSNKGWSNKRILIFQAFIFWAAHIPALSQNPFDLIFTIPIASIGLGLLVWRTRSLAPGIITHALSNTLIHIFFAD
jgi:membrane protease YdiL (CAAX protease family)